MFGEALRLIRTFHDVSQIDLAASLDISRSYLSEIESGKKTPSIDLLQRYSVLFKIPLSTIMFFSEAVEGSPTQINVKQVLGKKAISILRWIESRAKLNQAA
jgi:transcriptional regulator with XRE-family HTH domain